MEQRRASLASFLLAALGLAACGLSRVGSFDDSQDSGGGSSQVSSVGVGGSGATTGSGTPTSSGGGSGDCSVGSDCPGMDSDCETRTCVAGNCGLDPADEGSSCESGSGECNGFGTCKRFAAEACSLPADCLSNECADGVCCDAACDGQCVDCNLAGSVGSCTTVAEATPEPLCSGVCDAAGSCLHGDHLWSRQLDTTGDAQVHDLDTDSLGKAVVGGGFSGAVDFGDGNQVTASGAGDGFVAKYNADGTFGWAVPIGGTGDDAVRGVALLPNDNVVAAGQFTNSINVGAGAVAAVNGIDTFVVVLSAANGAILDGRVYGGDNDDLVRDVEVDGSGNVLLGGFFRSNTLDFSGGSATILSNDGSALRDPFVVKLSGTLAFSWQRSPTVNDHNRLLGLATDGQDRVIAVGWFDGSVNWGGGNLVNGANGDGYVVSLGATGTHAWSRSLAGNSLNDSDVVRAVAVGAGDDVLISGTVFGGVDFGGGSVTGGGAGDAFVARYSSAGSYEMALRFSAAGSQVGGGVATDADGNLVVAGNFRGAIDLGGGPISTQNDYDLYVAKFAPSGAHLWSRGYGGSDADLLTALATAGTSIYLGGGFRGALDFGGGLSTTVVDPNVDGFIAKLAP